MSPEELAMMMEIYGKPIDLPDTLKATDEEIRAAWERVMAAVPMSELTRDFKDDPLYNCLPSFLFPKGK